MSEHKHHFLDGPMAVVESLEILGARQACEALIVQYAFLIDFDQGASVADLFTDDGIWEVVTPGGGDPIRFTGRDQIGPLLGNRKPGVRSRHVMSNVGVNVSDEDNAQGGSYVTLYRAEGVEGDATAPLTSPSAVGEYRDVFRRGDDGIWRFAHRQFHAAFTSPDFGL